MTPSKLGKMVDASLSVADILRPADCQDDFTKWLLDKEANCGLYVGAKRLPDGSYAAVLKLAFTEAICLGVKHDGLSRRFCYDQPTDLLIAFHNLQSEHDTPTGWISSRPKPVADRCRPISTAPVDGSYVRVYHFDRFGCIKWCRTASYQNGWIEVDSSRDGEPLDPTHWMPE